MKLKNPACLRSDFFNSENNYNLLWFNNLHRMCCFRCKFTQILKAIHNHGDRLTIMTLVVFDANLHKFWKQFTTILRVICRQGLLFSMQIYTNFESNSQPGLKAEKNVVGCFRCKFTQILKAIHNWSCNFLWFPLLFSMQIYTNFESNSQLNH